MVLYLFGITIRSMVMHVPFTTVAIASMGFVIGDVIKAVVASLAATGAPSCSDSRRCCRSERFSIAFVRGFLTFPHKRSYGEARNSGLTVPYFLFISDGCRLTPFLLRTVRCDYSGNTPTSAVCTTWFSPASSRTLSDASAFSAVAVPVSTEPSVKRASTRRPSVQHTQEVSSRSRSAAACGSATKPLSRELSDRTMRGDHITQCPGIGQPLHMQLQ